MPMRIAYRKANHLEFQSSFTAIFLAKDQPKSDWLAILGNVYGSQLDEWMHSAEFGADEDSLLLLRSQKGSRRLALIGLGKKPDLETLRRASARAIKSAVSVGATHAMFCVPEKTLSGWPPDQALPALVEGAALANYRFDRYQSDVPRPVKRISKLTLISPSHFSRDVKRRVADAMVVCDAVDFSRDLANAPPNDMTPAHLAAEAAAMCRRYGIRYRSLGRRLLQTQGFGGVLCVAQGSAEEPRFIVMEYRPVRKRNRRPIVLVGKGVTFDAGGLSIKPAADMDRMKFDMSGGAFVIGIMKALAALRLPLHVIGLVPAAENLLGSKAYRPGDIVRMYSGKTVEILNTDAEGRLLLADALTFTQRYKPEAVIDLATLTGHCVVALGSQAAGLFTQSPVLRERLMKAAAQTGERIWELPLYREHEKAMKSHVADLKNSGGRPAGASTAAAFLKEFVGDYPWAHLDIAGTAYTEEDTAYTSKASSTGFGVRLIVNLLQNWPNSSSS